MNLTGNGYFKNGNPGGPGRPKGSIKDLLGLDNQQYRNRKRYFEYCRTQDFRLMAHLARPKPPPRLQGKIGEFDEHVQFVGYTDEKGCEHGKYQVDPFFELRVKACLFRFKDMMPAQPKEVEVSGQVNHAHLIHELKSLESKYQESSTVLEIQESGANGYSKSPSTNGSKNSALPGTQLEPTKSNGTESQEPFAMEAVSHSSSPDSAANTLERLKTPEP